MAHVSPTAMPASKPRQYLSALPPFLFSLGAFIVLVLVAHFDPDDFSHLDTFATNVLRPLQSLPWVQVFIGLSTVGATSSIILLAGGTVIFLRRSPHLVVRLLITLIGAAISVWAIKQVIARARPETLDWLGPLHTFSFPSGHATSAVALFGFVAVIVWYSSRARSVRVVGVSALFLLILGIGLSRIVLAAHYASDVLAGYVLGGAWLSLAFLVPLPTLSQLRARMKV